MGKSKQELAMLARLATVPIASNRRQVYDLAEVKHMVAEGWKLVGGYNPEPKKYGVAPYGGDRRWWLLEAPKESTLMAELMADLERKVA